MAGGPNQASGLPVGAFRQARVANYMDDHVDARMPVPQCTDPNILALARAIACSIKEARPNVTLPPHIYIPWKAQPWFLENRMIFSASTDATIAAWATEAGDAEGINVLSETGGGFVPDPGNGTGVGRGTYTVPKGQVLILREWAAQVDDGGYFIDESTGYPIVRFSLNISQERTIYSVGLLGNKGNLENPFAVSYVIPEGHTVAIQVANSDNNMWHLIESYMSGHLIATRDINDTLAGLIGGGACGE